MFTTIAISRAMFEAALNIVDSLPLSARGRRGFVSSHRDKLFFLVLFLAQGIKALKVACLPHIKTAAQILNILQETVKLYGETIVSNTIAFRHESCDDFPRCSAVMDCTVVEIHGPALPFKERGKFASGKHKRK